LTNFNNSQRLGLDVDKHIALDAGAGTGKTTVMAQRYIQHLLSTLQRSTLVTPIGPRDNKIAPSSLTSLPKLRTSVEEWPGLLPSEVVAITFTRKAAAELKARIRDALSLLRDTSSSDEDDGVFDPRIQQSGDVEMLLSQLDNAPISTIDSFLHQLIQPYLDIVATTPPSEQISEEMSKILIQDTLSSVWRLRHVDDALNAGLLENPQEFLGARDRLAVRLGGQSNAEVVIQGLMSKSMFVEEAHRNLLRRAQEQNIEWNGHDAGPVELLYDIMLDTIDQEDLDRFFATLFGRMTDWVEHFREFTAQCIPVGQAFTQSRMHHLIHLIEHPPEHQPLSQLRWIWRACLSIASLSSLKDSETPTFFPRGTLPSDDWQAGLFKSGESGFTDKHLKKQVFNDGAELSDLIKQHLLDRESSIFLLLAKSVFTLQPEDGYAFMPAGVSSYLYGLNVDIPHQHHGFGHYVSEELQMDVLRDLFFVHKGTQQIHSHRKAMDGFNDFDDVLRFSADILLSRCPDICRHIYPREAVDALDSMTSEPWTDMHIARAMTILHDNEECRKDLQYRYRILQTLRRQFRAFIIDEYQDTNPSHARLLARLWGRRTRTTDEVKGPLGYWEPTICIVGDMKQSIYRFRQAEVSVMRTMVEQIREANRMEEDDERFSDLRRQDHGRDPRPVGDGASGTAFTNKHSDGEKSAPFSYVHVAARDDEEGDFMTDLERVQRRREGHIDLTTNYRTRSHLLEFMNDVFDDVFSPRHETIVGNWYADAQRLRPGRTDDGGYLEWLIPIQTQTEPASTDMNDSFDPFLDSRSSLKQLENELIAQRVASLLSGQNTRIWDTENQIWIEIGDRCEYQPRDIMILFHARTHVPDLIQRLSNRGIPAVSDKQGALLHQPVIQPLLSMLEFIAYPESRRALFGVLRSPLVGLSDDEINTLFTSELNEQLFSCFESNIFPESIQKMFRDVNSFRLQGRFSDIFTYLLDYSDLLVVHSNESERNHVEAWCTLLNETLANFGYNILATQRHIRSLKALGKDGPPAESSSSGNAVQIMTLHKAKGLQAKVVIVAGMFGAGQQDASQSVRDNVLVTPQIVAGRIQPWTDHERPQDGLWEFTKAIEDAQGRAERRRQLYVALTRAEERLILVGSPSSSEYDEESQRFKIKRSTSVRSFGNMLIDAMRHVAKCGDHPDSPWLLEGDIEAEVLAPVDESPLFINPAQLFVQSTFRESTLQTLQVYHHPDCFSTSQPTSVLHQTLEMYSRLQQDSNVCAHSRQIPHLNLETKGTVFDLDSSFRCQRRHWLSHVLGWQTEPLNIRTQQRDESQSVYPNPTDFGLIMHRLLEVGLPNPCTHDDSTPFLSNEWFIENESKLLDETTIEDVLLEFGISPSDAKFSSTKERVKEISTLMTQQRLGMLLQGVECEGFTIEAVRTELPFRHIHKISDLCIELTKETPYGLEIMSIIDDISMIFEGRIDLAIALRDGQNNGYLQVVDLKTKGCLDDFSHDKEDAHPLQENNQSVENSRAITPAELELLEQYRLQLTMYSMVLESIEQHKEPSQRRTILPPSILVGASGRMIQLSDEQYTNSKTDILEHLSWRASVLASSDTLETPPRLESDKECRSCPFFIGDIRRCGPVSEPLGLRAFDPSK
jgi:ATP-dependent exoDNAse (exonuclease V) beta subunit